MNEPLLDLATVVERETVRIRTKKNADGKLYDYRNLNELSPFDHQTIVSRHAQMTKLAQLTRKMTAAEKRALNKALADILKLIIVDLEPAVLAEMEETVRAQFVTAWALKNGDNGAAEGEARAGRRTTAGSSRASRSSTAATPKTGSTRRRTR